MKRIKEQPWQTQPTKLKKSWFDSEQQSQQSQQQQQTGNKYARQRVNLQLQKQRQELREAEERAEQEKHRMDRVLEQLRTQLERDTTLSLTHSLSASSRIVFGEGCSTAKILVVGEAPGWQEAKEGRPFIGKSGTLLRSTLESFGLDMDKDVFITNGVRIRPPPVAYLAMDDGTEEQLSKESQQRLIREQQNRRHYRDDEMRGTRERSHSYNPFGGDDEDDDDDLDDYGGTRSSQRQYNRYSSNQYGAGDYSGGGGDKPTSRIKYKDRPPTAHEVESHMRHLRQLILAMQPNLILCFGRVSSTLLMNDLCYEKMMGCDSNEVSPREEIPYVGIKQVHGRARSCFIEGMKRSVWMVPFYHPSYILQNQEKPKMQWLRPKWERDIRSALAQYRDKRHLVASDWLVLDPEEAGLTSPEAIAQNITCSQPNQEFFVRPPTRSAQEILAQESFCFQCDEIMYDKKANEFMAFGRTDQGESVCATVKGFRFHFYTRLPRTLRELQHRIYWLQSLLWYTETPFSANNDNSNNTTAQFVSDKQRLVVQCHLKLQLEEAMQALVSAISSIQESVCTHMQQQSSNNNSKRIQLELVQRKDMTQLRNRFEPLDFYLRVCCDEHWQIRPTLSSLRLVVDEPKLVHYEDDIQAVELFTYELGLRMCSWVEIPLKNSNAVVLEGLVVRGDRLVNSYESKCTTDIEFRVDVEHLVTHDPTDSRTPQWSRHAPHRLMSFDIETLNSFGRFPQPNDSPVINASFVVQLQDDNTQIDPDTGDCPDNQNFSFTLRACSPINGSAVHVFRSELRMLEAILNFVQQVDPDQVWGHNVKRFDLSFIVKRAEYLRMSKKQGLKQLGRVQGLLSRVEEKKFQSRAFGERIIINVPIPGRAVEDSMEVYMREMKLPSYTLNAISKKFLGDEKNDMPYVAIPGFFWGSPDDNRELNDYCKKDANLVMFLVNKHKWYFNIAEFARINGTVSPDGMYVRGQQIKVFSGLKHTLKREDPLYIAPTKDRPMVFFDGELHERQEKELIVETYELEYKKHKFASSSSDDPASDDDDSDSEDSDDSDSSDSEEEPPLWDGGQEQDHDDNEHDSSHSDQEHRGHQRHRNNNKKKRAAPSDGSAAAGAATTTSIPESRQTSLRNFVLDRSNSSSSSKRDKKKRLTATIYVEKEQEILSAKDASKYKWATTRTVGEVENVRKEREERVRANKEAARLRIMIQGATVFEAVVGLHTVPQLCSDFASLYPSIMIRFNYSPDCKTYLSEYAESMLELCDLDHSPIPSLPRRYKERVFPAGEQGMQDKKRAMEDMYFIKNEWRRTVFESDLLRLVGSDYQELATHVTAATCTDTQNPERFHRVHPMRKRLLDLLSGEFRKRRSADTDGDCVMRDAATQQQQQQRHEGDLPGELFVGEKDNKDNRDQEYAEGDEREIRERATTRVFSDLVDLYYRELCSYQEDHEDDYDDAKALQQWLSDLFSVREERLWIIKNENAGRGVLCLCVQKFLDARKVAKGLMAEAGPSSPLYPVYNGRQLALKILANSTFGATSVEEGKLSDTDIGGSITASGREAILLARDKAAEKFAAPDTVFTRGFDMSKSYCAGGDTDSFFMSFAFVETLEQGMEFGPRLVNYLNQFYKKPMSLEFEKTMFPLLVYAKKRYTGLLASGEENSDFFEKKRWVEFYVPPEEWESVVAKKYTEKFKFRSLKALDKQYPPGSDARRELVQKIEELPPPVRGASPVWVVTAYVPGMKGYNWWKNDVGYKTRAEWYGYKDKETGKWVEGLLSKEKRRRMQQTDEEWMADFMRPRYQDERYFCPANHGRLFAKGIEIVRRDAFPFAQKMIENIIRKSIIEGKTVEAILDTQKRLKDLKEGRVDPVDLISSKLISKEHYKTHTMPHTYLMKKMQDESDQYQLPVPELGDRVPFLVVVGGKNQKMYERAEHPKRVIEQRVPIDYDYYYNKCLKSLRRTLKHFMLDPDRYLLDPNRISLKKYTAKISSNHSMFASTKPVLECKLCKSTGSLVQPNTDPVCHTCMLTKISRGSSPLHARMVGGGPVHAPHATHRKNLGRATRTDCPRNTPGRLHREGARVPEAHGPNLQALHQHLLCALHAHALSVVGAPYPQADRRQRRPARVPQGARVSLCLPVLQRL